MTSDDRQAEIAAMVALLLPIEISQTMPRRLAAGLRRILELLPPSDQKPMDRAMRRDLLTGAEALDQHT